MTSAVLLLLIGLFLNLMPLKALGFFGFVFILISNFNFFVLFPALLIFHEKSVKLNEGKMWHALIEILRLRYLKIYITAPKIDIVVNNSDINSNYHFGEESL